MSDEYYIDIYFYQNGMLYKASREFPTASYGPVRLSEAAKSLDKFAQADRIEIVKETKGCSPISLT